MASGLPHTRLVHVAEREADTIALMVRAQALRRPTDWLNRPSHDRALPEGAKLWAAVTEDVPLAGLPSRGACVMT